MKSVSKLIIVVISTCFIFISSCRKPPVFPDEPQITYKSLRTFPAPEDSAQLTISFTDGDGDIGVDKEDTLPNLFLTYQLKRNNVWKDTVPVDYKTGDPIPYHYRVNLPTEDRKPSLQGDIMVSMIASYYLTQEDQTWIDTIRFAVYLKDRALHQSNTVYTEERIVNQ